MNTTAAAPSPQDEWSMGGSKDPQLEAYGISETEVVMCVIDAMHYAVEKAGGNRQRFAYELSGEFMVALHERLGVELPDE